jgi:hypothetical protein
MAKEDMQIWNSVTLLFLSKFVTSTNQTFAQRELINPNNIDLGIKFASMLGTEVKDNDVRGFLKNALRHLEQQKLLQRSPAGEMHLTPAGIAAMQTERARAMEKIAKSFPGSVSEEQMEAAADRKPH